MARPARPVGVRARRSSSSSPSVSLARLAPAGATALAGAPHCCRARGLAALPRSRWARGSTRAPSELLSVHMVQHMLLGLVAAPLLVAGAPIRLALRRCPRRAAGAWPTCCTAVRPACSPDPLVGLALFAGTLAVVHVPAVYEAALAHRSCTTPSTRRCCGRRSRCGLRSSPSTRCRTAPAGDARQRHHRSHRGHEALGAVLVSAGRLTYPGTRAPTLALGGTRWPTRRTPAAIMWVGGWPRAAAAVVVAWQALAAEERRQRARDLRTDAQQVLG